MMPTRASAHLYSASWHRENAPAIKQAAGTSGSTAVPAALAASRQDKDYFVEQNGLRFAGTHLLIDLWEASHLDDEERIAAMMREAVAACQATLLNLHLHRFSQNGGISGVAVLAESHISIHTWPERDYAAVDIFMCGECDPYRALPILREALCCNKVQVCEQKRGVIA